MFWKIFLIVVAVLLLLVLLFAVFLCVGLAVMLNGDDEGSLTGFYHEGDIYGRLP